MQTRTEELSAAKTSSVPAAASDLDSVEFVFELCYNQRAFFCASELCDRLEKSSPRPQYLPRCRRFSLAAAEPRQLSHLNRRALIMGTEVFTRYVDICLYWLRRVRRKRECRLAQRD